MDDNDIARIQRMISAMLTTTIGPMGDMARALMSAQVDGLIDARKRFLDAGWPDWLIQTTIDSLVRQGQDAPARAGTIMAGPGHEGHDHG